MMFTAMVLSLPVFSCHPAGAAVVRVIAVLATPAVSDARIRALRSRLVQSYLLPRSTHPDTPESGRDIGI